jgi:polyisoprenoid-binding protein YceI
MTADRTAAVHVPPAGRYRLEPGSSTVSYSGRHLFGLGKVHATFTVRSGELQVTDPATASSVTVAIDAASFRSSSAKRDRDVTGSSLLDAQTFPDITFVSHGVREDAGRWLVAGSVTAHGTTVPVELVLHDVHPEGGGVRLRARAEHLDRQAFGITGSKGMVGRFLDLDLDAFASKA